MMTSAPVSRDFLDCLTLRLPFHCGAPAVDVHCHSHDSEILCDSPCALVPDAQDAIDVISVPSLSEASLTGRASART